MRTYRSARTLKRLALLAVFLLVIGFVSPTSSIQPSNAAPESPQAALAPDYAWHTFLGSDSDDEGFGIAVDDQGNIYLVSQDFASWNGPGNTPPVHPFTGGYGDIVVIKLDPNGNYLWHTFYGSNGLDEGTSIALDVDGNIFVCAVSEASWLGDSYADPLHAFSGGKDIAVLKLTGAGQYQWHTFYGSDGSDAALDIDVDSQGNAFVAGNSDSPWDGDAAPLHRHSGANDIAVIKLSADGAYLWHTFYGSLQVNPSYFNGDNARALAVDDQDNLFVTGWSPESWLGDEDTAALHAYNDGRDFFVLKLSSSGAYRWHTFYGSGLSDDGDGIVLDQQGNPIVSGDSSAAWNGDGGAPPLHAQPFDFAFTVLKLSTDGAYQWHTFYGSTIDLYNFGVAVTPEGEILLGGEGYSSWLGAGNAAPLHAYSGDADITLLQLNADGSYAWHSFYGSDSYDAAYDVVADGMGNLLVVGSSDISWLGDGDVAPLSPHSDDFDITLLKFAGGQYYLPLLQR
jgi:hypothetical protein